MVNLADRLRILRQEKRLTQDQLGKMFGVGKSTISMYENENSTPDDELKKKLAEFFEVSLDYLMGSSDIKESADKILNKKEVIIDEYDDCLPSEAKKELKEFVEFLKHKYGKK